MPSFSDFAGFEGFCFCSDRAKPRWCPTASIRLCSPLRLQAPRWSLKPNPSAEFFSGPIERSAMNKVILVLALASLFLIPSVTRAQFANAVLSYDHGTGFAANFTNANAAIGAPTSGSSVTPFAPPFSTSQIVSIGAGGSLTLQLSTPMVNSPANPFGIDLLIFGNSFFVVTNGSGSSARTSGAIFTSSISTRVEVSADALTWFTLDPARAPIVGTLFPTDGIGDPGRAVNPALTSSDFAGLDLSGIRSLYNGSAGGARFDHSWAQDGGGNNVNLASIDYVRIDVLSGRTQIDAIAVVPEPSTWALGLVGLCLLWLRAWTPKITR